MGRGRLRPLPPTRPAAILEPTKWGCRAQGAAGHAGQLPWHRSRSRPLTADAASIGAPSSPASENPAQLSPDGFMTQSQETMGLIFPLPRSTIQSTTKCFFPQKTNVTAAPLWLLLSRGMFGTCDIRKLQSAANQPPSLPQQSRGRSKAACSCLDRTNFLAILTLPLRTCRAHTWCSHGRSPALLSAAVAVAMDGRRLPGPAMRPALLTARPSAAHGTGWPQPVGAHPARSPLPGKPPSAFCAIKENATTAWDVSVSPIPACTGVHLRSSPTR